MVASVEILYVDPVAARREAVAEALGAAEVDPAVAVRTAADADAAERSMGTQLADAVVARSDLSDADGASFLREIAARHPGTVTVLYDADADALVEAMGDPDVDDCVRDTGDGQARVLAHRVVERCAGRRAVSTRSETDFTALADAASDVFLTVDMDGIVQYANPAIEDVLGYAPAEVVGEPLTMLAPDRPDDRQRWEFQRYVETDERTFDWDNFELPGRRADGREVLLGVSCTEFSVDGERRLAGIVRDITAQKERERRLERDEAMLQAVRDGVYALDDEGRYVGVNQAYADLVGRDPDELVGERAADVVGEELHVEADRLQTELTADGDVATLEATVTDTDGGAVPVEVRISRYPLGDGRYGRVGVVRDVTERRRREEQLTRLNELAQALTAAETATAVAEAAVETAAETLDLPLAAVELYDEERGGLERVAGSPALASLGDGLLFEGQADVAWRVFVESSGETFEDLRGASDSTAGLSAGSAVVLPVGRHGAFVAGTPEVDALDETDVLLAQILAANVRAALERVEREQTLRDRKEELERRTEALERVERINAVIRDLTRALTRASTRDEIERAVCTRLASVDSYRFVWFGSPRTVGGKLEPRASAGVGDGYLDAITVTTDASGTGQGPAGRAARTREPAVQNNLHADPPFEPWRAEALRRGYRSCLSVPVVHRSTLYGVVTVYADRPVAFGDMEVSVLGELGQTIGYSINALERKRALVSDRAVELEFEIDDGDVPAIRFADETDSRFEFDALIERSDGSLRAYFTVIGCDPETVRAYVARDYTLGELDYVGQKGDGHLFEVTVSQSGFLGTLVENGATPTRIDVTPEGSTVTVELPGSTDVSAFIDAFLGNHEEAELVARRELDRPVRTESEFRSLYLDRLTERQQEVIETAYFAGFFEWPRRATGGEVAELLGVSQPTVNRHIRNGERKLFGLVFEDDGDGAN